MLIGDSGVGKTSILKRQVDDLPPGDSTSSTIGVDFKISTQKRTDPNTGATKNIKLQIWDTAGQERFRTITRSYYRGAHVIMLVYDITSLESFNSLPMWLSEVEKNSHDRVIKLVVGNKADMEEEREVSYEQATKFCEEHGMQLFETSAVSAQNIEECFDALLDEYMKENSNLGPGENTKDTTMLTKPPKISQAKKGCC